MNNNPIIKRTKHFVQDTLKGAEGGHDWFHILRVYNNAIQISQDEDVDVLVVSLSALLHDIADSKFHNGDETIGPHLARTFLNNEGVEQPIIEHVVNIIEHMSFSKSLDPELSFTSREMEVVQDADRLDAIGAIGIARCFNYGGFKNRTLYDPEIAPNLNMSKTEYKASTAPTINHFYEKLLLLKDSMNTETGKRIAEQRHAFMEQYLEQFYNEWNGNA